MSARRTFVAALVATLVAAPLSAAEFSTQKDVKEAFIRKIDRDIKKVDKSISVTKDLIARSKAEKYLPDLVFRLAELYVEKSRLVFFKIMEEAGVEDKRSITAPEARLLKDAAIREYNRILNDFPGYQDNDKITFFIAHEQRELGDWENMLKSYLKLVEKYPKSNFRNEAWLIVGDHYFEKSDLDTAESYYKKILTEKESYVHPMARFKLGWCYLNREKWKEALSLFETVAKSEIVDKEKAKQIDSHSKVNVKREALTSLVYAYPEVKKPEDATKYFRELVSSRAEYLMVLEKLARRYSVKQNYLAAGDLYRELLKLSHDVDRNIDYAQRVYDAVQASKKLEKADRDVRLLVQAAARYRFSWRAKDDEKDAVFSDFEQLTRDLATKLHVEAQRTTSEELFQRAGRAYKRYLSLFIDSPSRTEMRWNYADSLYQSKQYVEAGREFETLARDTDKDDERKKAMTSAINAYFAAIKEIKDLNRYQSAMAREGLKTLGAAFVSAFPDDAQVPAVKFNVARAYYEQGEFDKAIELFIAFAREYPMHKDGLAAANLALDAYNNKEDYAGLAKVARELAQIPRLGDDAFKKDLLATADKAEQQMIDTKVIQEGQTAVAKIAKSEEYKGTNVAAKAAYQAFAIAKDRRDVKTMMETGQQILDEFGNSDYAKDVLSSLGEMAIRNTDFAQGAGYYEKFAQQFPRDDAATDMLASAAKIRLLLGDYSGAMTDYERVANIGGANSMRYFIEMAAAAEDAGEWRRVILAATPVMSDSSFGLEARARAGTAMLRAGQEGDAASTLMSVVQDAPPGKAQGEQATFAARAAFYLGEILRTRYEAIQFGKGDDAAILQQKFGLLNETSQQYITAIQYGDPEYGIGALFHLGEIYRAAADFLENAPKPEGLAGDDLAVYQKALKEQADVQRNESKNAFKTCREKAAKLSAFNRYVKGCLTEKDLPPEQTHSPPRQEVEVPGAADFKAKIVKNPKDVDTLVEYARAANAVGDHYLAKLIASKALEINDSNSAAHLAIAVAEIQLGNYQLAYSELERAKDMGGGPAVQANMVALYTLIGDAKKARAALSAGSGAKSADVAPKAREAASSGGI